MQRDTFFLTGGSGSPWGVQGGTEGRNLTPDALERRRPQDVRRFCRASPGRLPTRPLCWPHGLCDIRKLCGHGGKRDREQNMTPEMQPTLAGAQWPEEGPFRCGGKAEPSRRGLGSPPADEGVPGRTPPSSRPHCATASAALPPRFCTLTFLPFLTPP